MENAVNESAKSSQGFVGIIITQCICVAVILIGIICIKYFFKDTYKKVKVFYEQSICADTDISEVLPEEYTLKSSE